MNNKKQDKFERLSKDTKDITICFSNCTQTIDTKNIDFKYRLVKSFSKNNCITNQTIKFKKYVFELGLDLDYAKQTEISRLRIIKTKTSKKLVSEKMSLYDAFFDRQYIVDKIILYDGTFTLLDIWRPETNSELRQHAYIKDNKLIVSVTLK